MVGINHCLFVCLLLNVDVGAFIVMEWVEGEMLEHKISQSSFGRNKRREVCKQMLEASKYPSSSLFHFLPPSLFFTL